jgi:hypothetical protein
MVSLHGYMGRCFFKIHSMTTCRNRYSLRRVDLGKASWESIFIEHVSGHMPHLATRPWTSASPDICRIGRAFVPNCSSFKSDPFTSKHRSRFCFGSRDSRRAARHAWSPARYGGAWSMYQHDHSSWHWRSWSPRPWVVPGGQYTYAEANPSAAKTRLD